MSKESKALPREFWIEQFNGRKDPAYYAFLDKPNFNKIELKKDDGEIIKGYEYYRVIEYSAILAERAKSQRLLEVIKQVKVHLRAPVHFDALVQMSQICGDILEEVGHE